MNKKYNFRFLTGSKKIEINSKMYPLDEVCILGNQYYLKVDVMNLIHNNKVVGVNITEKINKVYNFTLKNKFEKATVRVITEDNEKYRDSFDKMSTRLEGKVRNRNIAKIAGIALASTLVLTNPYAKTNIKEAAVSYEQQREHSMEVNDAYTLVSSCYMRLASMNLDSESISNMEMLLSEYESDFIDGNYFTQEQIDNMKQLINDNRPHRTK